MVPYTDLQNATPSAGGPGEVVDQHVPTTVGADQVGIADPDDIDAVPGESYGRLFHGGLVDVYSLRPPMSFGTEHYAARRVVTRGLDGSPPPSIVRIQTISSADRPGSCDDRRQGVLLPADRYRPGLADPFTPWFYSGDLLTVEYRTDPRRVAELLPPPLEPAPDDPGAVALIWADWQSCSSSREELLDPVRSQYKEAFVVVRCSFGGRTFSRCVFIWVDKDFAIGRGVHQGYPKKLGSMWQTRPHPFSQGAPQIAAGGVFGATLAAGDRRLAEAVLTLREESPTNGFVNDHPMAHHRIFPGIASGAPDAYAELISSGAAHAQGGQAWRGDVEVRLFESPTEELHRLEVQEVIGGYYRQVGVVWDGGQTLATLTAGGP